MRNDRAEEVITVLTIDLAKQLFHLFGAEACGARSAAEDSASLTVYTKFRTPS